MSFGELLRRLRGSRAQRDVAAELAAILAFSAIGNNDKVGLIAFTDVVERFVPYYTQTIEPDLRAGKTVLIAAHGNSLRALVKYLDGMSDDDVVGLNIPTGIPLRYDLDGDLKPRVIGGEYLDPEAAAAGAAAVAAQGAK